MAGFPVSQSGIPRKILQKFPIYAQIDFPAYLSGTVRHCMASECSQLRQPDVFVVPRLCADPIVSSEPVRGGLVTPGVRIDHEEIQVCGYRVIQPCLQDDGSSSAGRIPRHPSRPLLRTCNTSGSPSLSYSRRTSPARQSAASSVVWRVLGIISRGHGRNSQSPWRDRIRTLFPSHRASRRCLGLLSHKNAAGSWPVPRPDLQRLNQSASALKKYRPLKYFIAAAILYRIMSSSGLAVVVMAAPRGSGDRRTGLNI